MRFMTHEAVVYVCMYYGIQDSMPKTFVILLLAVLLGISVATCREEDFFPCGCCHYFTHIIIT